MTKIDFNKETLIALLATLPKGYGEGKMMSHPDAVRIANHVADTFFIVHRQELPSVFIDVKTLEAHELDVYVSSGKITSDDNPEHRYFNVLTSIAHFLAAEEIEELVEERAKEKQKDIDLAFSLLKVADPLHLKYVKWEHVPRSTQDAFLNVARKAREELAEK